MADAKDETPLAPRKVSKAEEKESLGFLASASKGKSKRLMGMMKKAGWNPGYGMGKHEQGMSEAITVKVRPKGAGVGTIDEKTEQQKRKERKVAGVPLPEDDAPEDAFVDTEPDVTDLQHITISKRKLEKDAWRKKKKEETDNLLRSIGDLTASVRDTEVKIVDLFEEEKKTSADHKKYYLYDLRVGISKKMDSIESNLRNIDSEITAQKHQVTTLKSEVAEIEQRKKAQGESIEQVGELADFFEKLNAKIQDFFQKENCALLLGKSFYSKFRSERATFHQTEFVNKEINELMVTTALPLFHVSYEKHLDEHKQEWHENPIAAPTFLLETFLVWRELMKKGDGLKLFYELTWDLVGTKLATFVNRGWNARKDSKGLALLLAEWAGVLSPSAMEHLLINCIAPKLMSKLKSAPSSNVAFVLSWTCLKGGLEMLDRSGILVEIQTQLTVALPSMLLDDVHTQLTPFATVLPGKVYTHLVSRNVLKRVSDFLTNFAFSPEDDVTETMQRNFAGVFLWSQERGVHGKVAGLLEEVFFPKMLFTIACFARSAPTRVAQATAYYSMWRTTVFTDDAPQSLQKPIREGLFSIATLLLAAKAWWAGKIAEDTAEYPAFSVVDTAREAAALLKVGHAARRMAHPSASSVTVTRDRVTTEGKTFKELIEEYSSEEGIDFAPRPNVFHEGKQVYALGVLRICFEASLMHVQRTTGWTPVDSIRDVLHEAAAPKRRKTEESSPAPEEMDID